MSLVVNDGTVDSAADTVTITAASVINLPQTGQTTSYATGDDGELQKGVAWPSPRFTITYCDAVEPCVDQTSDCDSNASTDMVTDNLTGLMWARDGNLNGVAIWADALTYANGLSLCGYTDWRLPNRKELHSLTDFSQFEPALPSGHPFNNVQSNFYWSSTTYAYYTGWAWGVYMYYGFVDDANKTNSSSYYYVWPVRAETSQPAQLPETGQTTCYDEAGVVILCPNTGQDGDIQAGVEWHSPRFTDKGDGTVTDNLTGLMWLKDGNCFGAKQWFDGGSNYPALETVEDFNSNPGTYSCTDYTASYTDWRLPNVNELESLINAEEASTATWLYGQGFSNVQSYYYWSSTTFASSTDYAWYVVMFFGRVSYVSKTNSYYIWPVRAGQ